MKYPVRRRVAAQDSLKQIAAQIAEHVLDAAYRFVDAVEASLSLLRRRGSAVILRHDSTGTAGPISSRP